MAKTKITFALDASEFHVMLGKRAGNAKPVTVDLTRLPENALAAIFLYGMQRKFNDKVGGADKTVEEKVKAAEAMRDRFYDGEVSAPRGTGAGKPAWWKFAAATIRENLKSHAKHGQAYKEADTAGREEMVQKAWDNLPAEKQAEIQTAAEERLEAEREAAKRTAELDIEIKL